MIKLVDESKNIDVQLPTELSEITPEFLEAVVKDVTLSEHYAIIALVYKTKLFNISMSNKAKGNLSIYPLFVKANSSAIKAHCKDRVIISTSNIEMADHLPVKTSINLSSIANVIEMSSIIRNNIIKGLEELDKDVYTIAFKIVPVNDIKASYPMDMKVCDYKVE